MWTIRLSCTWSYGLLWLDRGVIEAIAAFDQVYQPVDKTSCRAAIGNAVIEAQRHAEIVANGDVPIDDTWLRSQATQRDREACSGHGEAPAVAFPEHSNCRYPNGSDDSLMELGKRPQYSVEYSGEERGWQEGSEVKPNTDFVVSCT